MKMKKFGLTETKLFHFHRIFKNGGQGGGPSERPEPPLDPPLLSSYCHASFHHSQIIIPSSPNTASLYINPKGEHINNNKYLYKLYNPNIVLDISKVGTESI